jgi:AcrR family transcriptional regulator
MAATRRSDSARSRQPPAAGRRPSARSRAAAPARAPSDDRRQVVVEEAARLFGSKGYEKTSMRDIATAVGILPGSLYHHFRSKEELFVAVYSFGVAQVRAAGGDAVARHDDPWDRLQAACAAHLESLLGRESVSAAVISHLSIASLPMRAELVALRDRYEALFEDLVDALALPAGADRRVFRLALLGAMNWSIVWYRPGRDSPSGIARKILGSMRHA